MTTTSKNLSTTDLRDLAFRDLESSLATIKETADNLGESPLALRMKGAVGVAETSLRIIAMTQGAEIKALTGPLHGEDDKDFDAGGAVPIESSGNGATEKKDEAEKATEKKDEKKDETGEENGNGKKSPASYAIAHAKVKHACGAKIFGCPGSEESGNKMSGNAHGRHEQLCVYFQTARLLQANYDIATADDYAKAIKKEYGKLPYASVENMKKEIDRKHGSYRKVLLAVKAGLKAQKKASAKAVAARPGPRKKAG